MIVVSGTRTPWPEGSLSVTESVGGEYLQIWIRGEMRMIARVRHGGVRDMTGAAPLDPLAYVSSALAARSAIGGDTPDLTLHFENGLL